MTLDELIDAYDIGYTPHLSKRAGIRAVVEALRDEMRTPRYSSWEDIDDFMNELLASDGVKSEG